MNISLCMAIRVQCLVYFQLHIVFFLTQGKLQRSLLLCIKLCNVVIQAAQYGFQSL